MSKISNYYLELQDKAQEMGFDSVEDAFANGYEVVRGELKLKEDEQTKAHKAWLEEKEQVLAELAMLSDNLPAGGDAQKTVEHAIEFLKKGEM